MKPLTNHDHVVRVDGALDAAASRAVVATAVGVPAGEGFVVDLSEAAPVDDVAVAFLAEALAGRVYRLRGLTGHHERLLRYLGLASCARTNTVSGTMAAGREAA